MDSIKRSWWKPGLSTSLSQRIWNNAHCMGSRTVCLHLLIRYFCVVDSKSTVVQLAAVCPVRPSQLWEDLCMCAWFRPNWLVWVRISLAFNVCQSEWQTPSSFGSWRILGIPSGGPKRAKYRSVKTFALAPGTNSDLRQWVFFHEWFREALKDKIRKIMFVCWCACFLFWFEAEDVNAMGYNLRSHLCVV